MFGSSSFHSDSGTPVARDVSRNPFSSRPVAAAALAIPDLAELIFSAHCSRIRGDFHSAGLRYGR